RQRGGTARRRNRQGGCAEDARAASEPSYVISSLPFPLDCSRGGNAPAFCLCYRWLSIEAAPASPFLCEKPVSDLQRRSNKIKRSIYLFTFSTVGGYNRASMRTLSSSIMAALVVVALFWGNCFSCPQALLAQKTE